MAKVVAGARAGAPPRWSLRGGVSWPLATALFYSAPPIVNPTAEARRVLGLQIGIQNAIRRRQSLVAEIKRFDRPFRQRFLGRIEFQARIIMQRRTWRVMSSRRDGGATLCIRSP